MLYNSNATCPVAETGTEGNTCAALEDASAAVQGNTYAAVGR